jgi:hypothetical protein
MSLWTPGGEIPVDRGGNQGPSGAAPGPAAGGASGLAGGPSLEDLSPTERAQAEAMIQEMAEVQQQIAATPASQLVANHAMGLYELAAIKLAQDPPRFVEAQLAIDAMAAVLDATAERMGQDAVPLRQGLTQLQLAFVELKNRGDAAEPPPG